VERENETKKQETTDENGGQVSRKGWDSWSDHTRKACNQGKVQDVKGGSGRHRKAATIILVHSVTQRRHSYGTYSKGNGR